MRQNITAAILEAERQRCTAMLGNDITALDHLLDPRLVFAHATGALDDKAAYMTKMAAGKIAYIAIDWRSPQVTALGEAHGLLTGLMATHVRVDGLEKRLDNRVTMVWSLVDGAWRMLAFQSTPLKI